MTSAIDLNPNHLDLVERILAEHVPGCEVRAFGSRAAWTARDYSDVDLAVVGDGPLHWRTLSRLREAFEESRLPMRVDVLDWHAISEGFREAIKSDCVVVQAAGAPMGWPKVRLGECVVINESTVSPEKDRWPYVNYLDTGNITKNRIDEVQHLVVGQDKVPTRARRKVQTGDIVYSTVRPNQRHHGLLKEVPENLLASTGFAVIRAKHGLADTGFVYWLLTQDHIVEHLQAVAEHSTSAYPSIKPGDLEAIEFPLPPMNQQRAIARVLGALDDRIELKRRMSETLEEMARALFRSWFVDFDPVRAKAEGRPSGLPADLDALFPASFEPSELGEIPTGWEVKSIYESAQVIYGAPFSSRLFNEARRGLPLIRIRDLRSGNPQVYTDEALSGARIVLPGRIVVGMDGEFRAHLWQGTPAYLNQRVCEFVERSPASRAFVLYGLEPLLMEQERTKTATTVIHLLKRDIDEFRLVTPPASVHEGFRSLVEPLVNSRVSMTTQARALAGQRDALLPKLVSGELRAGVA